LTKAKPGHYIATICQRRFDTVFISPLFSGWTLAFNSKVSNANAQFIAATHQSQSQLYWADRF
jgi:hypothetical protein